MIKLLCLSTSCYCNKYLSWSAYKEEKFIWLTVLETPVWSLSLLLSACGHHPGKEAKEKEEELEASVSFKDTPPPVTQDLLLGSTS